MPTIVLNKSTTNPNIPVKALPGFFDNFNRPNSPSLGKTSREGREWKQFGTGATLQIVDNQASLQPGYSTGYGIYTAEGLASDGTYRAKYSNVTDARLLRMAFRMKDDLNFYALGVGAGSLELRRYVNLEYAVLKTVTIPSAAARTVSVVLNGPSIKVMVEGVTDPVIDLSDPTHVNATKYGFQALYLAGTGAAVHIDEVEFSPAK